MSDPLSEVTISAMYQMYLQGHSMKQVGSKFGVSKQRISELFMKHNLKRRLPHYHIKSGKWK